jgi:hypothetical protein
MVPLFGISSRRIVRMTDVIQEHDLSLVSAMGARTGDLKRCSHHHGCGLPTDSLRDRHSGQPPIKMWNTAPYVLLFVAQPPEPDSLVSTGSSLCYWRCLHICLHLSVTQAQVASAGG